VNEGTIVPFVSDQLNNLELALGLAKRGNLPGAEALVGKQFEQLFAGGKYKEAAEAAADSPQVCSSCMLLVVHFSGGRGEGRGGVLEKQQASQLTA
jgi:hypothetical protein